MESEDSITYARGLVIEQSSMFTYLASIIANAKVNPKGHSIDTSVNLSVQSGFLIYFTSSNWKPAIRRMIATANCTV